MPKILEIKEIDGDIWCRLGKPGAFESGVTIATPEEWEKQYSDGYEDAMLDVKNGTHTR